MEERRASRESEGQSHVATNNSINSIIYKNQTTLEKRKLCYSSISPSGKILAHSLKNKN